MSKFILLIAFLSFSSLSIAQNEFVPTSAYKQLTANANNLYNTHQFSESGKAFDSAFESIDGKGFGGDFYNAACSWALANNKKKAFKYLNKIARDYNWSEYVPMEKDSDLISLHSDYQWQPLIELVTNNFKKKEAKLNKPLAAELDTVLKDDQEIRLKFVDVNNNNKVDTITEKAMYATWQKIDSINLVKVTTIIDKYGWLGADEVGENGASALFLVIQHAPLQAELKYLPLMREAVKKGKAKKQNLALLEDRVLMYQGKKQIYGSQVSNGKDGKYEFYPIKDEIHVNERRAKMNLEPLEEYAKSFGFVYTLPNQGRIFPKNGLH